VLRLEKILSSDTLFPAAWDVLTASFPGDERRSLEAHRRIETDPRYEFCAILADSRCAGAVGIWRFPRFMFIEHLAIEPSERSRGSGTGVVRGILEAGPLPAVIEVESASVSADALRRIVFYRTLGFVVNEYDYIQPAYDETRHPVPMLLLTYPSAMSADMLDHMKHTLYKDVYDDRRNA